MARTVRVNVSIPAALREQMKRTKGINWSLVAAIAFGKVVADPKSYADAVALQKLLRVVASAVAEKH